MQYNEMSRLSLKTSLLGFGAMRFPLLKNGEIDVEQATEMIHYAIDNGVNYIDTAWVYHNGESEKIVGNALKNGYRDKVSLATKNPTWLVEKEEDWEYYLNEQLKKLNTESIDFYLQHSLDKDRWERMKKFNFWEKAEEAKRQGKIRYYGFSFHDSFDVFEEIINAYDWNFCQIQLNYLDQNYQAGLEGLKLAKSKNIPVIIMEPLRGGLLANELPEFATQKFEDFETKRSPVEWALRWLTNREGIGTILSGMSSIEQVKDNVRICSLPDMKPNCMTKEESDLIQGIVEEWNSTAFIKCTNCKYCNKCPKEINISECFNIYNKYTNSNSEKFKTSQISAYKELVADGGGADNCLQCKLCESVCPQSIKISEKLKQIHKELGGEN